MSSNYQQKRKVVRIILISLSLIIPFVKINGNSLLRFDIGELILYLFGYPIPIKNFFFVLLATLFVTFLFVTMTLVYGRIWCGWLCPQSVSMEVTAFVDKLKKGQLAKKGINLVWLWFISFVVALDMVFYFVDPYKFFNSLIFKGYIHPVTLGFIVVLTILVFLDLYLVRYRFCATICPYSMIQSVLYDDHTLAVYMIPETKDKCINCLACVKVCSTGIDIRKGLNSACINCAKCIDACQKVMEKWGGRSLFAYLFGPNNNPNLSRPTVLISGAVTLVFLIVTVVSALNIKSYSVEFMTNPKFYPRYTADEAVNGFQLMLENLGAKEKSFRIELASQLPVKIEPDKVFVVGSKEKIVENVFIKFPREIAEKNQLINLTVFIIDEKGSKIEKKITFRKPFAKRNGVVK
ncbi:MAG: 4Fe-4S binding protein [Calditerrivibrio sp.]|nr:4Fe-4S binding protein [Calditerrivibrio sp.]